ncbi:tyrosine-type recombinase/integrase [Isoptericola nanjingensis]|uniref:tyrosine-type recombinase/integrase n=1 Tax=Isoptericola nanjingensis TaxID=903413 RepID=UPI003D1F6F71
MTTTPKPPAKAAKPRRSRRVPGVRQLPSGRWQVRFTDPAGVTRTLGVYDDYDTAVVERSRVTVDVASGTWQPPAPDESLADYLARWLERRSADLSVRTRDLYESLAARWLLAPVKSPDRAGRGIELGPLPLRAISVTAVADWYAIVRTRAAANVDERIKAAAKRRQLTDVQSARRWALAAGLDVPRTGALSPTVVAAWREAGAVRPPVVEPEVPADAGRQTAALAYSLLRTVLGDAAREGLIPVNPCQVRGAGGYQHDERVPATPEQVVAITGAMPERYAAAVPLLTWGALRFGEMAGLRRRDVKITRDDAGEVTGGAVRVERAMTRIKGQGAVAGDVKTRASKRTVNLPASTAAALAAHLDTFTGRRADDLVFTSSTGGPLQGSTWTRAFIKARAAAGRPDLHAHDLRHTGLTFAYRALPDLKAVQARAGHATARAALIYQHMASTADTDIADRLDALTGA